MSKKNTENNKIKEFLNKKEFHRVFYYLKQAIIDEDFEIIKYALGNGMDFTLSEEQRKPNIATPPSLLSWAIKLKKHEIVKYILENNPNEINFFQEEMDTNSNISNSCPALNIVAFSTPSIIKKLINNPKFNINQEFYQERVPLNSSNYFGFAKQTFNYLDFLLIAEDSKISKPEKLKLFYDLGLRPNEKILTHSMFFNPLPIQKYLALLIHIAKEEKLEFFASLIKINTQIKEDTLNLVDSNYLKDKLEEINIIINKDVMYNFLKKPTNNNKIKI